MPTRRAAIACVAAAAVALVPAPRRFARARAVGAVPPSGTTFDWRDLVRQDRGLEWIRLSVLLDEESASRRRPPFFRGPPEDADAAATRDALEGLAGDALQHVALGRGAADTARLSERLKLARAAAAGDESAAKFVEAVDAIVNGGSALLPSTTIAPPRGAYGDAFARFAAEAEAAKTDVDFCLSLRDRTAGAMDGSVAARGVTMESLTATRALNDASNDLLRAAAYGDRDDVAATRLNLQNLAAELRELPGHDAAADAYLDRLDALARSEGEYSPERAAVEDASFATFYLGGAARAPAAALGDAYSVALQRFLGELTRRGAIATGDAPGSAAAPNAPDFSDDASAAAALARSSQNPLVARANAGFAEWEMAIRRRLARARGGVNAAGLHPADFVGTWRLTLVDDAISDAGGPLLSYDASVLAGDASPAAVEVTFADGGAVALAWKTRPRGRPPRWRVRPGPAHLDTCEFEIDVDDGRVAFCGYVDRGQRIEARFSRRPIRVSGFAFEKGSGPRRLDADARPSGQFRMSGPARDDDEDK